jgi:hypothetical protein
MDFIFDINSKGHVRQRESSDVEFKESFHKESILIYLRTLVAMANNHGGQIIFGVKNSPHVPIGLKNEKFHTCDPKEINQLASEYFSPEVEWEMKTFEFRGLQFGKMWVKEGQNKPVICKKNHDKLRIKEAAIYYRYRGETKEIAYPELHDIIEKEKEKEKMLWLEHVQKISSIGPKHIHILDSYKGEIHLGSGKILLEKSLMDRIKFIKEGRFVEKDGAPALRLLGEIAGIVDTENSISTNDLYPVFTSDLSQQLAINPYHVQSILFKMNIKGNRKYHEEIKISKGAVTHKYSSALIPVLQRLMKREGFLSECDDAYRVELNKRKARKKRH